MYDKMAQNDYDKLVVKWTEKAVEHFRDRQDALAFLASRIASENCLVFEYGYAIRDLVRGLRPGQLEGRHDVFFELGRNFDLLICPEKELDNENFIKDKAIVIEFKVGTVGRGEGLVSSALVGGIPGDLNKLKNKRITNGYVIGFLYICNDFKQAQWRPLEKSESFKDLRDRTVEEIKEKNNGIVPLNENDGELIFEFSSGELSGKACFLIYKTKQ